jgi:hypothetical protein
MVLVRQNEKVEVTVHSRSNSAVNERSTKFYHEFEQIRFTVWAEITRIEQKEPIAAES